MTTYNKYDLNKDGRVNQSDLDYLESALANGAGIDSMDLNGDGAIDDKDIQALKQYLVTTPPDPFPDDEYTRWIIKSYLNPEYKIKPKIFWRGYEPVYHDDINTLGKAVLEIQEKLKPYEPPAIQLPEDFDSNNYGDTSYLYNISSDGKDRWTLTTGKSSQSFYSTSGLISDVSQVPFGLRFATPYKVSYFVPFFYLAHWQPQSLENFNYCLGKQFAQINSSSVILENSPSLVDFQPDAFKTELFPLVHFPQYFCSYVISYLAGGDNNMIQKLTKAKEDGQYEASPSLQIDLSDYYSFEVMVPLPEGVILYSQDMNLLIYFVPDNGAPASFGELSPYLIQHLPDVGTVFDYSSMLKNMLKGDTFDYRHILQIFDDLVNAGTSNIFPSVNGFSAVADDVFYQVELNVCLMQGVPFYIPHRKGFKKTTVPTNSCKWKNYYNVLVQGAEVAVPAVTFLSDFNASSSSTSLANFPSEWTQDTRIAVDSSGVAFVSEKASKSTEGYEFDTHYVNYFGLRSSSFKVPIQTQDQNPPLIEHSYPCLKQGLLYFTPEGADGASYLCSTNFRSNKSGVVSANLIADPAQMQVKYSKFILSPELTDAGLHLPLYLKPKMSTNYFSAFYPIKRR